jgi:hypothetical protein
MDQLRCPDAAAIQLFLAQCKKLLAERLLLQLKRMENEL